jgi:hypothetical protein
MKRIHVGSRARIADAAAIREQGDASVEQSEGRDFTDGTSEIVHEAPLLVSCIWCEKLHRAEKPLEFNPVCSTCEARYSIMRSLEMKGSHPLSNQAIDEVLAVLAGARTRGV